MIAVIGCGNANRTDDAAGLEVIRILHSRDAVRRRPDVHLLDAGTDGMAVMFAARGCKTLIVIDACRTGADPGAIFEVPGEALDSLPPHSLNLHDFRWDNAIYAGRQIFRDQFPSDVTAYLIEVHSLELGCGLSTEVQEAVQSVAHKIAERIGAMPVVENPRASAP